MKRLIVDSLIFLSILFGWLGTSLGQSSPRGELRIVDRQHAISIVFNVFERLMEFDQQGQLVPRLATHWQWRDHRTLEIHLRRGVTFHNGERFDASIVKLNWDEYLRLQPPHLTKAFLHFKSGTRLEIVNPYTVRFHFPEPDGAALFKLSSLHMGNRQFYDEHGWDAKRWGSLDHAGPWGTGPYEIVEGFSQLSKQDDQIILVANTQYWDPQRFPRLQRIVFDNSLSQSEALQLVKTKEGRMDLVSALPPLETLRVAKSPFAKVVKNQGALTTVFGLFNMHKANSPWRDVRLRRAVNLAIDRDELIRDVKGNGTILPALLPVQAFGYNDTLTPYTNEVATAQQLLREAGYDDGLTLTLIAPRELQVQGISISMMLELAGLTVDLQLLDEDTYHRMTHIIGGEPSPEQQDWDIALWSFVDYLHLPSFRLYYDFALEGPHDWVDEQPVLRQLYERALDTVDVEQQRGLIRQMERHTHEQAYFLFLYHPVPLYALNKAVAFTPSITSLLTLDGISVTDTHWSVREAALSKTPAPGPQRPVDPTNAEQVAAGQSVYQKHCATCHGANLEGQPNWRQRLPSGHFPAPPHDQTGHTWHHPDPYLFETIKYGWQRFAPPGYQSAMRGFQEVLSDAEIWAVLAFIKSHWPQSIQEQQERLHTRHQ